VWQNEATVIPLGEALAVLRLRPLLAAVAAAWLLWLAAESGPHLVHHLFDDGDVECQLLAVADHATPAIIAVPVVPIAPLRGERVESSATTVARTVTACLVAVRGPPAASLA